MADLIGRMLQGGGGGGGLPDLTKPSGGPWQQLGGLLGTAAKAGQHSPEYYRVAATYEGSAAKAESKASDLATFKDQPDILNDLIERDPYWQKHPKGKAYLKTLLGQTPEVRPETLPPTQRAATYRGETQQLLSRLPGMRAGIEPESEMERRWVEAMRPGMMLQKYPAEGFRPSGLTEEQQKEWATLAGGIFGGMPPTATEAAKATVRGEVVPEPSQKFARWLSMKGSDLSQINENEQALVAYLTEGASVFTSFPGDTEADLAMNYGSLMADEDLKSQLGIKEDDLSTFSPENIKRIPFMGRMSIFVNMVNSLRPDDKSAAYILWNWFEDIFAGAAGTPPWAKLAWEE